MKSQTPLLRNEIPPRSPGRDGSPRSEHPSVDMKPYSPEIGPIHTPRHRNEIQNHSVPSHPRDYIVRISSRFFEMKCLNITLILPYYTVQIRFRAIFSVEESVSYRRRCVRVILLLRQFPISYRIWGVGATGIVFRCLLTNVVTHTTPDFVYLPTA